jgi:hypothetical protein
MVVAQQGQRVFRIGAFGELGEATQVSEQRRYLSTMTFELFLGPRRSHFDGVAFDPFSF